MATHDKSAQLHTLKKKVNRAEATGEQSKVGLNDKTLFCEYCDYNLE